MFCGRYSPWIIHPVFSDIGGAIAALLCQFLGVFCEYGVDRQLIGKDIPFRCRMLGPSKNGVEEIVFRAARGRPGLEPLAPLPNGRCNLVVPEQAVLS